MFRCLILDLQRGPTTPAETSDDDHEITAELDPHSSSSHWEWRLEYEVPPPEPGDPVVTRRRSAAKRPPTVEEEEEIRQKRLMIGTCARIVPTVPERNCLKTSSKS